MARSWSPPLDDARDIRRPSSNLKERSLCHHRVETHNDPANHLKETSDDRHCFAGFQAGLTFPIQPLKLATRSCRACGIRVLERTR
jgi:hypothetical protein